MRKLTLTFVCLTLFHVCFSQKNDKELDVDTTSKTKIERLLHETSIVKKIEFVEIERVKVLDFRIIIVTNLKTGSKFKGLYLSKGVRHVYLDEDEIAELISFIENCDKKWKTETPFYETQYEFETLDNLRITFWTPKNSKAWTFAIKFTKYRYENIETLGKSQSDELLEALKRVKEELQYY